MASTHDPPFLFLALPAELRNQIYADILTKTYILRGPGNRLSESYSLAILRVSKAVYEEANKVLYEKGTFFIIIQHWTTKYVCLRSVPL